MSKITKSLEPMVSYKIIGNQGEQEIINLIVCPNCSNKLMLLPESYPMYDLQCVACSFRAQVKTSNSDPYNTKNIRGAGWDVMDKVLKAGFLVPPLIINFKWGIETEEKREIRLYPFIKRDNLRKRVANIKSDNRVYNMFDYDLVGLVYYTLFSEQIHKGGN